jgi:hypothetical protein
VAKGKIMGQQIASSKAAGCAGNPTAAPVRTAPDAVTIAAGAGDTPEFIYEAAAAEKMPYGGKVLKTNECDRLKIVVSYLDGGDCNACTPDTVVLKEETYFAEPGGAGYDIGAIGYVAKVEVTVVDSAGAPTTSVLGGDVSFESERAALCSEVLMPADLV